MKEEQGMKVEHAELIDQFFAAAVEDNPELAEEFPFLYQ